MGIDRFHLSDFRSVTFSNKTPYFEEKVDGKEYIYDTNMGSINGINVLMRVYSSVHTDTEQARQSSNDSIKVKLITEDDEIISLNDEQYKKITRQHGWEDRLKDYINFLTKSYPSIVKLCGDCGRPMILRKKYGDLFAGCSGWSPNNTDCSNTDDI